MQLFECLFSVSRLFISPSRHKLSLTPKAKLNGSTPDESSACDPLPSCHSSYPPQPVTPPRDSQAPPTTTPQQRFPTTPPNPGCTPAQLRVAQNGPIQPYATPPRLPYHPGFSPQYPFPGYVLPPGYEVPYTTDSINPLPPTQEEIDQQGMAHLDQAEDVCGDVF